MPGVGTDCASCYLIHGIFRVIAAGENCNRVGKYIPDFMLSLIALINPLKLLPISFFLCSIIYFY